MANGISETKGKMPVDADVMNDPAYDENTTINRDDGEKDTCRICRSEGTTDEPLFHPCKCSGSIKHVHQECLMEWLSHTNKKHCELCKTPFRFTKLYAGDMPDKLPFGVFLTRAGLHIAKYFLTWLRGLLVVLIWLILLPWSIRWTWRGLFFMMDAGWAREPWIARLAAEQRNISLAQAVARNATTPSDLPVSPQLVQSSYTASLVFGLWNVLIAPYKASSATASLSRDPFLNGTIRAASATFLSDLDFGELLADSPSAKRIILDVMEGQIITIVVVIAFILVFLIREWVIQQQPILNAAAHVREAEQQLHRVEQARQRLQNELRIVENELDRMHAAPSSSASLPASSDKQDSSHIDVNDPSTQSLPARRVRTVEWSGVERLVLEASERFDTADVPRTPESIALVHRLTTEVVELIQRVQQGEKTDVDAFTDLTEWVRSIPLDIDTVWLSDISSAFSVWKPRSRRGSSDGQESENYEDDDDDDDDDSSSIRERQLIDNWEDDLSEKGSERSLDDDASVSEAYNQAGVPSEESSSRAEETLVVTPLASSTSSLAGDIGRPGSTGAKARVGSSNDVAGFNIRESGPRLDDNMDDRAHEALASAAGQHVATPSRPPSPASPLEGGPQDVKPGLLDQIFQFFWGDIDVAPAPTTAMNAAPPRQPELVNAQVVQIAQPDVIQDQGDAHGNDDIPPNDPDVAAAAAQAGIDAEAIEDAEDLEGVLELIGMQGPLVMLFQTALFCALLVTVTLWGAVGGPYLFGKLALQILGDPVLFFVVVPLRVLAGIGDLVLDIAIGLGAAFAYGALALARQLNFIVEWELVPALLVEKLPALEQATISASERTSVYLTSIWSPIGTKGANSYFLLASLQAHQSLNSIKYYVVHIASFLFEETVRLMRAPFSLSIDRIWTFTRTIAVWAYMDALNDIRTAANTGRAIIKGNIFSLPLRQPRPIQMDPALSYWSGSDRAITTLVGYVFIAGCGLAFAMRSEPFFTTPALQRVEKSLAEVLKQAGGVIKVITIISIEMLLFPFYCGMLLDLAMLPLFEGVTFASRIDYARRSPYMFTFLHWFLGTAYMFNFALFVSMCRRILRSGVLYFIRDPDDPTFHPVRDVLERNISTQLRKIAFSALVYGLMVILCLGGIIWAVASVSDRVFPLRWSAADPVLEFPMEFLVYNLISPFIFRLLRPSRTLENAYEWWLRKCARRLQLSHFMFGERRVDEETASHGKAQTKLFYKVPASDQVRVQRGQPVFVPVTEEDVVKGEAEQECNLHGRPNQRFRNVYVPPWFRLRIALFLGGLWMMCAGIGVGFTIVPLLVGRGLCALAVPSHVQLNDLWAYSVGMHALLFLYFGTFQGSKMVGNLAARIWTARDGAASRLGRMSIRIGKCLYVWGFTLVIVPTVFASLVHLYLIVPSHTLANSYGRAANAPTNAVTPSNMTSLLSLGQTPALFDTSPASNNVTRMQNMHNIYILPDWTLGFVLSRFIGILTQAMTWALPAAIYHRVIQPGRLNPDVRIATRAFILPVLLFSAAALVAPFLFATSIIRLLLPIFMQGAEIDKSTQIKIYRYTYPVLLAHVLVVWATYGARKGIKKWKERIKDEVYLVGERLHNFGERKPPEGSKGFLKKGKENQEYVLERVAPEDGA